MSYLKSLICVYKSASLSTTIPKLFTLRLFHKTSQCLHSAQAKQKADIQNCCSILEVEINCTESELKAAYLKKVKDHHPDKQKTGTGRDSSMFNKIYDAYQTLSEYKRDQAAFEEAQAAAVEEDDEDDIIRHTVPQHRQYLTFEGYGYGTPGQRGRQFQQFKVARANDRIYEHRKMKFGDEESAVVAKDKAKARKIKTSNLIDRIVDDLVRESMQRGDFDNLPGKGKPLDYSDHNPLVDTTTHNLNKIMVNNGFMPEWIMVSKEIRNDISTARQQLAIVREQLGPPPYCDQNTIRFDFHTEKFKRTVQDINKRINRFNLIVPFMEKQMVNYDINLNVQKVMNNHLSYLPTDDEGKIIQVPQMPSFPLTQDEEAKIQWGEVWSNIKGVFKYR